MVSEIVPDAYDITLQDDGNGRFRSFFFVSGVPTLVDTGLASTTETLFDAIDDIGIEPERVVITHGDGDHIGGLEAVVDRYDVETWVPESTDVDDALADNRFGDADAIGAFTAVHVPGHTDDHHALVDEERDLAVLGDAVFGADARGLPAGYFVLPTAFYSADLATADDNLARLLEYDFSVGLVYHGSSVTTDARSKIASFVDFDGKPSN